MLFVQWIFHQVWTEVRKQEARFKNVGFLFSMVPPHCGATVPLCITQFCS